MTLIYWPISGRPELRNANGGVDARNISVTTRQIRHRRRRAVHLLLGGGGHCSKLRSLTLTLRSAVNLMGDRFGVRALELSNFHYGSVCFLMVAREDSPGRFAGEAVHFLSSSKADGNT